VLAQAAQLGWILNVAAKDVQPISTAEYPLPAARPAYGLLDSQTLARHLGSEWPTWQAGVDRVLSQLRPPARAD
jgi:dTDP-4-dehydrorhamnose reductase